MFKSKANQKIVQSDALTGVERAFNRNEFIVSKTDSMGNITYGNDVFFEISGYSEQEMIGQPHNLIRHPDMPRCVFKLLWEKIKQGDEIFAYVINKAKNGDHYWVLAHVTSTFNATLNALDFHSNRRVPNPDGLQKIKTLYRNLLIEEQRHSDRKIGIKAGTTLLLEILKDMDLSYDEFIYQLEDIN